MDSQWTMKSFKPFLLLICFLSTSLFSNQQALANLNSRDTLDKIVNKVGGQFVNTVGHYGLSIGIIKNGKIYRFNFGSTDSKKNLKPTDHSLYEIASVTKSFTGLLLAHAVIENKISLEAGIQQYLPKRFSNLAFGGAPIKIKHLVTHTSGLPKFIPRFEKNLSPDQMMKHFEHFSAAQFLDSLAKVKLNTVPGTKFIYSNADAQLIGIILEEVYHDTYANLLKKYITGPQLMNDTRLDVKGLDDARFVRGHNQKGEVMPGLTWWQNIPAAGYIKSDISDMLKYLKLNLNEKDQAVKLAHRPLFKVSEEGADSIGIFWFVKKSPDNQRIVYHAGGSFGTTSYCEIRPDQKSGIILISNDASPGTEDDLKKIAALLLNTHIERRMLNAG